MHRQTGRQKQADHNNPLLSSSVNDAWDSIFRSKEFEFCSDSKQFSNVVLLISGKNKYNLITIND